jgi:putative transposase
MPNHVHLVLVPARAEGLGRALGETHRRYGAAIDARLRVTGRSFQGRYASAAMDQDHRPPARLARLPRPPRRNHGPRS